MALEAQNNPFPSILLVEGDPESLPDADPASGQRRLAVGTDHLLYLVDNSGAKHAVAGSSGLSDPMTTRGDVIVRNASNVTARLGIGSSGKVLSSDGTDISWQTPSGSAGALVLLEQHTASSSATLDFTSFITSTYDDYLLELVNIVPATNSVKIILRCSTDGGSTYDTSSIYDYVGYRFAPGGSANAGAVNQSSMNVDGGGGADSVSNTATRGVSGRLSLYSPLSTVVNKQFVGQMTYANPSVDLGAGVIAGVYKSTTAVNAIRFLASSGNLASGTIRVYGIAK